MRVSRPPVMAAVIFTGYYVLAWLTGARFNADYLEFGWQLVPRDVLTADPFGAAWNLHIQPPGWNLMLGVLLRVSPFPDAITLQLALAASGALLVWLLADLTLAMTRRAWVAVAAPLFAALHPDAMVNLFEPKYEIFVELALTAMVWIVVRAGTRRTAAFVALAAVGVAITMTRAMFHPAWLLLTLGYLIWRAAAADRRRFACIAAAGLAVPLAFMAKNLALFDTFTLSSWSGMNLLRSVSPLYSLDELERLANDGRVARLVTVAPFESLDVYGPLTGPCAPRRGHASLTIEIRPYAAGVSNFNHECYLDIYAEAGRAARTLIREHPGRWIHGRIEAAELFASRGVDPGSHDSIVLRLTGHVYRVADLELPNHVTSRVFVFGSAPDIPNPMALGVTLACATVGVAPFVLARRRRGNRGDPTVNAGDDHRSAFAIAAIAVWWTFLAGVVGELGEQARFRSQVQPLCVVLAAALLVEVVAARHARRAVADRGE